MKKLRAFLLTSSALLCFSLVSCNGHNDGTEETVEDESLPHSGDYTLMIYMCASTLESGDAYYGYDGDATKDIKEMLSINIPDNINVVLRTGGTSSWGPTYSDKLKANYIQTFRIKNKQLVEVKSQRKQYTSDSVTMSDKTELKNFVDFCKTNYPSSKNALILWDHGGGMEGVCQDAHYYRNSYPLLTNSDVDYALSSFTGDNKLEWIGYDACLMSVVDIAEFNSRHAKYMISSQENEPAGGWRYDKWLPTLCNNTSVSTETLLEKITDTYVDYYGQYTTLSVLNLDSINDFTTSWNDLCNSLSDIITNQTKWDSLASCIDTNALKYGEDEVTGVNINRYGPLYNNSYPIYPFNLYDLNIALNNIATSYSTLTTKIQNVQGKIKNLVIYNKYGSKYNSDLYPCGLSLYVPTQDNTIYWTSDTTYYDFAAQKSVYSKTETKYTNWQSLCNQYGSWYDPKP